MTDIGNGTVSKDEQTRLDRASVAASRLGGSIAAIAIIAMTALVATNTLLRAIPHVRGFTFAEEFTGYLFIIVSFMGLAQTFSCQAHVRVTIVFDKFGEKTRAIAEIVLTFVAIIIISIIGWYSTQFFLHGFISGEQAQTVMQTPLWIPRLFVPVGIAIFLLTLIAYIVRQLRVIRTVKTNDLDAH